MTSETKPPRPRRRIILKSIAVLFLAFIAYRVIWWATGTPAPHVDYLAKAQELAASYQPTEGENGWPLIEEAAEMLEKVNEDVTDLLVERLDAHPVFAGWYPLRGELIDLQFDLIIDEPFDRDFTKPEMQALNHLRNQGFFDLLDRAAGTSRMLRPVEYDPEGDQVMANVMMTHLLRIKSMVIVCTAAMRLERFHPKCSV